MFEPNVKKDYQTVVRFTQEERQYLETQAQAHKLSLSETTRLLIRAGMAALAQAGK